MFLSTLRRAAMFALCALLATVPAHTARAQTGVCCAGPVCAITSLPLCAGTFIAGATCTPNPCAVTGVCCRGATCNSGLLAADCTAPASGTAGAQFQVAAACNSNSDTTPCCYADYNKSGSVTVNDIFDYLSDWFAGSPYANTGGNGSPSALTVSNIFDFLSALFAGGCS